MLPLGPVFSPVAYAPSPLPSKELKNAPIDLSSDVFACAGGTKADPIASLAASPTCLITLPTLKIKFLILVSKPSSGLKARVINDFSIHFARLIPVDTLTLPISSPDLNPSLKRRFKPRDAFL